MTAREWMESHAIDLTLAASVGLYRKGNTLYCPVERADGTTFERTRSFPDGKWMQPRGESLACWWPLGRAHRAPVLICEGEGDTLAAASVLDKSDHPNLNALCPVGLPGVGINASAVAAELHAAQTPRAYICLDGDEAGRRMKERLVVALHVAGIASYPITLFAGGDLADALARCPDREKWLALKVAMATIEVPEKPPKRTARQYQRHTTLSLVPPPVYFEKLTGKTPVRGLVLCPLHDEKTPSCKVWDDPERGWFCYGCHRGGNIFSLAMALWDVNATEAESRLEEAFDLVRV